MNNNVIIGYNSHRFRYNNKSCQYHAEIDALRKLNKILRWKGIKNITVDLVVIRYSGNLISDSKPCVHCCKELSFNKKVKINKLYYSDSNGEIVKIDFNQFCQNVTHVSKGNRNK